MTRKEEIKQAARQKEKEVGFTQIVLDVKGVNSAYGIGFLKVHNGQTNTLTTYGKTHEVKTCPK